MKRVLIYCLFFLFSLFPLSAMADSFADVPQKDHWAYDAVNLLQEKGLVEGYPDGLFKGDRPLSRYEMAMVVARVMAKLQLIESSIPPGVDLSPYATKEDLQMIDKLIKEYKAELDALGVRVKNVEDSMGKITARVEELEKVFISGNYTMVGSTLGFTKEPFNPDPTSKFIVGEDYAGYTLAHGTAFTSRLDLDIGVNVNENVVAGGTLTAFSSFGDPDVAYSWGVLPPYNTAGYGVSSIYNNGLNFQATLNKLWFNTKGDWEVNGTFGEYYPQKLSPLVYYGVVTPAYWAPTTYPLYGINFNGTLYGNWKFEVMEADDIIYADYGAFPVWCPDAAFSSPYDLSYSNFYTNPLGFHNRLYSVLGGYETDKFNLDMTYMRVYEDMASNPSSTLIPKDEVLFNVRGNYKLIEDKLNLFGEFSRSWFKFNLLTPDSRTAGNAFIFGGEGKYSAFDYKGQFIRIDGNYEPFNLHQIFDYPADGMYIPSIYRPNRIGFNGNIGYNFNEDKGRVGFGVTYFKQVDPTLSTDPLTTIGSSSGFQDHAFVSDSTSKGSELWFDLSGNYQCTDKFYLEGRFISFNFKRDYALYTHDQNRYVFHVAGTYDITDAFSVTGLYEMAKIKGMNDIGIDTDSIVNIPGFALNYNFNENTTLGFTYRYYNYSDKIDPTGDYNLNRVSTWMTVKF